MPHASGSSSTGAEAAATFRATAVTACSVAVVTTTTCCAATAVSSLCPGLDPANKEPQGLDLAQDRRQIRHPWYKPIKQNQNTVCIVSSGSYSHSKVTSRALITYLLVVSHYRDNLLLKMKDVKKRDETKFKIIVIMNGRLEIT